MRRGFWFLLNWLFACTFKLTCLLQIWIFTCTFKLTGLLQYLHESYLFACNIFYLSSINIAERSHIISYLAVLCLFITSRVLIIAELVIYMCIKTNTVLYFPFISMSIQFDLSFPYISRRLARASAGSWILCSDIIPHSWHIYHVKLYCF